MNDASSTSMHLDLARQYFREAASLFARDRGRLWGVSLDGPMIFVDYETRQAAANQPDAESRLTQQGDIWVGEIPSEVIVANTAMTWSGVRWTMLLWQAISSDPLWRDEFFAHEAFHRVQDMIGFPMPEIPNANVHLDTLEGRYLLQLEWRALSRALTQTGEEQRQAIGDMLLFRAARREQFPRAAEEERALEMHEGLAEYTGFVLAGLTLEQAAHYVQKAPERYPSFVRSFAYASGPAYGLLLDALCPNWRIGLTPRHDFGNLLQTALDIVLPAQPGLAVEARALLYEGESLLQAERQREQERQAQIAAYRARLLDSPALVLPISPQVKFAFDPRATIPLPGMGTVFPFAQAKDDWGVLDLEEGGLLMSEDWKTARISLPTAWDENPLRGEGWTLHLSEGWQARPANHSADWEIIRT
jgi:hypothetical protein